MGEGLKRARAAARSTRPCAVEERRRIAAQIRAMVKRRWPDQDSIQHGMAEHIANLIETDELTVWK